MKFHPTECVKCGAELERGGRGRPSRFCSEGCKASVEAEMRRLTVNLRTLEQRRSTHVAHLMPTDGFDAAIDELQNRFDHLAGVPQRETIR